MVATFSRRQMSAMGLAWAFAPAAARAVLPNGAASTLTFDVADVGGFDPIVRRNADGAILRHNLALRLDDADTQRFIGILEDMRRITVAEFTVRWETPSGPQSLRMYDAFLLSFTYVSLFQGGRGQPFDEFAIAIESTHGSLRRQEARQTLVADYRVTSSGGVVWNRYNG